MQRTHDFIVDNIPYSTTHYTPSRGIPLGLKLMKIASGAAGKVGTGSEFGVDTIAAIVAGVLENISENEVVTLIKEVLSTTVRNNLQINFDLDFAGRYLHLVEVLKEVLAFQFGDFLAKSLPASAPATAKARKA